MCTDLWRCLSLLEIRSYSGHFAAEHPHAGKNRESASRKCRRKIFDFLRFVRNWGKSPCKLMVWTMEFVQYVVAPGRITSLIGSKYTIATNFPLEKCWPMWSISVRGSKKGTVLAVMKLIEKRHCAAPGTTSGGIWPCVPKFIEVNAKGQ